MSCGCSDPRVFGHDACYTTVSYSTLSDRAGERIIHCLCHCAACPCTCHQGAAVSP